MYIKESIQNLYDTRWTVTPHVAILVYITVIARQFIKNTYLDDFMSLLYAAAWTTCIVGVIISYFFVEEMMRKYNIKPDKKLPANLIGHVIPALLITWFGPKKSNIPLNFIIIALLIMPLFSYFWMTDVYVGVPPLILFLLSDSVFILSFYLRFGK